MPFHRSPIELTALKDLVGARQRGYCAHILSGQGTVVGFNPLQRPTGSPWGLQLEVSYGFFGWEYLFP